MAYKPGTVLTRKDPQEITIEPKPGETEVVPDPFNDVRVIGRNPISHSSGQNAGEWEGEEGNEIVVTPLEFGSNKPLPIGQLDSEYDIVSIPDEHPHAVPEPTNDLLINPDPKSPEQQFKAEEKAAGVEQSEVREATPLA